MAEHNKEKPVNIENPQQPAVAQVELPGKMTYLERLRAIQAGEPNLRGVYHDPNINYFGS
jgi:hypothetical protein